MKQLLLLLLTTLISTSVYSQRLYDNGALIDSSYLNSRFVLEGSKWNKLNLTYFINNISSHLDAVQREAAIDSAIQVWQNASKLTFTKVWSQSDADIKISWVSGDHGDGSPFDGTSDVENNILAHAFFPSPGGGRYAGELHFDDSEPWSIGGREVDLTTVAIHELGHVLGISHSEDTLAIMYPFYSGVRRILEEDDLRAIWALYGNPFTLNGPSVIGDGSVFSILGFPAGTDIRWNITGYPGATINNTGVVTLPSGQRESGFATVSATGNNITISRNCSIMENYVTGYWLIDGIRHDFHPSYTIPLAEYGVSGGTELDIYITKPYNTSLYYSWGVVAGSLASINTTFGPKCHIVTNRGSSTVEIELSIQGGANPLNFLFRLYVHSYRAIRNSSSTLLIMKDKTEDSNNISPRSRSVSSIQYQLIQTSTGNVALKGIFPVDQESVEINTAALNKGVYSLIVQEDGIVKYSQQIIF